MKSTTIETRNIKRPKVIYAIFGLTLLTAVRAQTLFFFSSLRMNGGSNPDEWVTPWITDSILGLMIPFILYLILKGKGIKIWAFLISYSAIGAFDYLTGLDTQWFHPMSPETAGSELVYSSLLFSFLVQTIVLLLLFKQGVINYYLRDLKS